MFVYVVYTFLSNFPAESDVTRDERSISEGSNHMQESLRSANSSTRSSVLMESKEEVFMFNTANPDLWHTRGVGLFAQRIRYSELIVPFDCNSWFQNYVISY